LASRLLWYTGGRTVRIAGLDPGVTSGFAVFDTTTRKFTHAGDYKDPLVLGRKVVRMYKAKLIYIVVIEDFVGSGRRNPYIVTTIKNLGFYEGLCALYGIPHKLQAPQQRRAFIDEAVRLLPNGHHFIDAGAHCLAAAHRLKREGKL
jgi:hypothetical protein